MAIDEIRFQGYNKLTDYLRNDRTGHIMENEFVRLYQSTNRLQAEMIVDYWMPNKAWPHCDVNDPSARVLANYGASGQ